MANIDRLRQMIERFPDSEVPRYSLATALRGEGDTEGAIEAFDGAIRCRADFMMAWVGKAELLVELERWDEAVACCEQAIELAKAQNHQGPLIDCEALLEEIRSERS